MTPLRSAFAIRAAAFSAVVLALLACAAPVLSASAVVPVSTTTTGPVTSSSIPTLTASLLPSSPTVPAGGTFGYTADIRLNQHASYLQAVLEVSRPSGTLLFKRTRVANNVTGNELQFTFERALTDALSLEPGSYPVKLSVDAQVGASVVSTETSTTLRVYAPVGPKLSVAIVARVTGRPMSGPDGRFVTDPARNTGARDAVSAIARRVLTDPTARVTLAVPPVLLAEWRRISGGYTLTSGVMVRPTDPVAVAYNSALADLRAAVDSQRLELTTLGYADPNLTDLANHGLAQDVGPQYDAGISAVFASIEMTPSQGTVSAGGCVPANQVDLLGAKGVRYIVVDTDCLKVGKERPPVGVYPVSEDELIAVATEESSTQTLSGGDPTDAIAHAFGRLMRAPKDPMAFGIEIDGDSLITTDPVGTALDAFGTQPWMQVVTARELEPSPSADRVRLVSGPSTPHAPSGFWKTVAKSRNYAGAYYAALGSGDPLASTAEEQSLLAEDSSWSDPDASWAGAPRGLDFANAALKTTQPVLDSVSMTLQPLTLSGASGEVPVTIVNGSTNTLSVVVRAISSGGLRVDQSGIPTTLRPQENYLQVPVTMQSALTGRLTVEVIAGNLVLERKSVTVRSSALDRLALLGLVVAILVGILAFIFRRARAMETPADEDEAGSRYTVRDDPEDDTSQR